MLFNSLTFLLAFLPLTLVGFWVIRRLNSLDALLIWLIIASFVFYAAWEPIYLLLLVGSIAFNYVFGRLLLKSPSRAILAIAIVSNVGLLCYYKYLDFLIRNINWLFGAQLSSPGIFLPLGISFITFVQVAFLVDIYRGTIREIDLKRYALFASYFPHLIAGPIIRYTDVATQFTLERLRNVSSATVATGMFFIVAGLFKKVVFADGIAPYVNPAFRFAEMGLPVTFFDCWLAAAAFAFQIYFDFSGYSDVAIGLSLLFGVRLPFNFDSPYKATSIIEFWRRWHMSLSQFLRDYIYIPLGGNRQGFFRRYFNLMAVMLIGGLWHGANWTFVAWGGLHGFYLIVNHAGRALMSFAWVQAVGLHRVLAGIGTLLVFPAVLISWVFFRAETWKGATHMLWAMTGKAGVVVPEFYLSWLGPLREPVVKTFKIIVGNIVTFGEEGRGLKALATLVGLAFICFFLPNTQQMAARFLDGVDRARGWIASARWLEWRPDFVWGVAMIASGIYVLSKIYGGRPGEFIYFQF